MAIIRAYRQVDTRDIEFHDGDVARATSRAIVIDNGVYQTTYRGRFDYTLDGGVVGRVDSIRQEFRGRPLFEAEGLDGDADALLEAYREDRHDEILPMLLAGADQVTGSGRGDYLEAFGGRDTVNGGDGRDTLAGGAGVDLLRGGSDADRLDGGAGADRLIGGAGGDLYRADARDEISERSGDGHDRVQSGESLRLPAEVEDLFLLGAAPIDGIGNRDDNRVVGNAGRNLLSGGDGQDRLDGAGGRDLLVGGSGADRLAGGGGNDVFRFLRIGDSSGARTDHITDFSDGDRIDLSGIDADETRRGDQSFDFIGRRGFPGEAGELRFRADTLSADTDGDRDADFRVTIEDLRSLHEDALLL